MLTRRGFLGTVLALGAAPAIVRASSLMPLWVPRPDYLTATEVLRRREYWLKELADRIVNPPLVGWFRNGVPIDIIPYTTNAGTIYFPGDGATYSLNLPPLYV